MQTHEPAIHISTHTRMLQLLCTLLDLILGASVRDDHQHLRDVPPHAVVWGEHLLIDVLQSNAWTKKKTGEEDHRTSNVHYSQNFKFAAFFPQSFTCLGVASSVADALQSWDHDAFVVVGVQFELGPGVIAVLHKWNLFTENKNKRMVTTVNTDIRKYVHDFFF